MHTQKERERAETQRDRHREWLSDLLFPFLGKDEEPQNLEPRKDEAFELPEDLNIDEGGKDEEEENEQDENDEEKEGEGADEKVTREQQKRSSI